MQHKYVLFLTDVFEIGGIETFLNDFSDQLKKIGIHSKIAFYKSTISPIKSNNKKYLMLLPLQEGLIMKFYSILLLNYKIYSLQKQIHFTHIFLNTPEITLHCAFVLIWFKFINKNIKIYFQFHGPAKEVWQSSLIKGTRYNPHYFHKKYFEVAEKFSYFISSNILCFSDFSKKILLKKSVEENKIKIIKPGQNLLPIQKKSRTIRKKQIGLNPKLPLILFISRMERRKGIYDFLEIVCSLKKVINANYVCCSIYNQDPEETKKFFAYHSKLDIGASLFYVHNPKKNEMINLYQAADLFIQPSTSLETFGYTIFESLQLSLPVACYDIGANSELVEHNKNGFIRKIKDKSLLIQDIKAYIHDNRLRKKLSKNALNSVKRYTWENYIEVIKKHKLL